MAWYDYENDMLRWAIERLRDEVAELVQHLAAPTRPIGDGQP